MKRCGRCCAGFGLPLAAFACQELDSFGKGLAVKLHDKINGIAARAIQFLCESRGLNKTLVEAFLLSGDIYEEAKRHNVVFVGRDRSGTPRYAHVRGTADPFRQDIAGSDKSYPFRYEGNGNQLFVFEAPIDLLSFICLYPQDWQKRNYLALGGVSGKALDRFLSERKDTQKVFLCLDSDTAGS